MSQKDTVKIQITEQFELHFYNSILFCSYPKEAKQLF